MTNPTLIVTGASRGIGKSTVLLAIQFQRANVIGVARSQDALQQLSDHIEQDLQLKDRFKFVAGDITAESTAKSVVSLALNSWSGRVDGLALNAGVIEPLGTIANTSIQEWKQAFDTNFFSILTLVQHALPELRMSRGRVILVNSGAAFIPTHGWGAYCSSKAALKIFGDILAEEESEVTTISIRPGTVDTEMQSTIRAKGIGKMTPKKHDKFLDLHKNKELLHPDDPGYIIAALAVQGPIALSGGFFAWNDDELKAYRKQE
ncbi:hypothetical protein BGZ65_002504 [Modicella reniformis]|uniref:NAD(P)-binding protein n=1 Tax=Modicella reniformis TaxID=1440133 RepID=A0A9P6J0J2_9FUNG|nr:hypothetical protein BGZ65_002504 [Modicella reniformis]